MSLVDVISEALEGLGLDLVVCTWWTLNKYFKGGKEGKKEGKERGRAN